MQGWMVLDIVFVTALGMTLDGEDSSGISSDATEEKI